MQLHGGELPVVVGDVVIGARVRIAAGGVDGAHILPVRQAHAALGLLHRAQDVEKLADLLLLRGAGTGIVQCKGGPDEAGLGGPVAGQAQRAHALAVRGQGQLGGETVNGRLRRQIEVVVQGEGLEGEGRLVGEHPHGVVIEVQAVRHRLGHKAAGPVGHDPVQGGEGELGAELELGGVDPAQQLPGLVRRGALAQHPGGQLEGGHVVLPADRGLVDGAVGKVQRGHGQPGLVHRVVIQRVVLLHVGHADHGVMAGQGAGGPEGEGQAARGDGHRFVIGPLQIQRAAEIVAAGAVGDGGAHTKTSVSFRVLTREVMIVYDDRACPFLGVFSPLIERYGSKSMNIQLSDHFTYRKLLRFTFPSMVMMIFTSIYGVVDGIFVSNFVGKTPFAAINLIMPVLMMFGALGFMVGTGGSALVAKTLGEGERERANGLFSLLIWLSLAAGVVLTVVGIALMRPVAALLGAEGEMLEHCVTYGRILALSLPAFILQNEFQSFLVTAERPGMGLAVTVAAGLTNIVLDALFVAVLDWGLVGAAAATTISQLVGGLVPLSWFLLAGGCPLKLGRPVFDGRALVKTCTNGSSELMTNLSMSLVNVLYNVQLMRFAGEDGVAAYGVIMYVNFIFISVFLGYSIGSAPIVGYHFGAGNTGELKNLFGKSLWILGVLSVVLTGLAEGLAGPLAGVFVSYDARLMAMTRRAFMLYSLSFLLTGINIYGSSFFTALNDGLVSAVISFLRTLVFQVAAVFVLPVFLALDGVWLSVVLAEGLAFCVTVFCFVRFKGKYQY